MLVCESRVVQLSQPTECNPYVRFCNVDPFSAEMPSPLLSPKIQIRNGDLLNSKHVAKFVVCFELQKHTYHVYEARHEVPEAL